MEAEESARKTVALIPEVYVDLIRRVLPGSLALAVILIRFFGPGSVSKLAEIPQVTQILLFLFFVFAGYVAGLIIDCITGGITHWLVNGGNWLSKAYLRFLWGPYANAGSPESAFLKKMLHFEGDLLVHTEWQMIIRDYAVVRGEYARNIIPKIVAEEFLLKNLAFACLLVGLSSPWLRSYWPFWGIFLVLTWAGFRYRARQTASRVRVLFERATKDKEDVKCT